ncbi:MAG: exo-alpha-sialidase, partial [bacterium]|nr:exo-alpha-sialidase [Candidatus Kapabacteria bacterium]
MNTNRDNVLTELARRLLITMLLVAAATATSTLHAQVDGLIQNVRQRTLVFGANGFIAAGPDTTTLPLTIASGQHYVGNGALDQRGGRFAHVYASNPSGIGAIYFRKSTNGTDWSEPIQLSPLDFSGECYYASVRWVGRGSTSNKLVAIYVARDPVTKQDTLFGVASTDGGATWTAPARVSDHAATVAMIPTLTSAGDSVYAVWTRFDGAGWFDTFINRSRNAGQSWDTMLVAYRGAQTNFYSHAAAGANGRV